MVCISKHGGNYNYKLFDEKNKIKLLIVMSCILYLIGLLGNSYYFLIENTIFSKLMDIYLKLCISTRNGLFIGVPMITAGVLVSMNENKIQKISNKKLIGLLVLGVLVEFIEVTIIRGKNYKDDHSMFFSTIFNVTVFLCILLKNKHIRITKIDTKTLRNLSTGIYFMHRPITYYISIICNDVNPWVEFIGIVVVVIITCILLYKINNKYINYVIK